MLNLYPANIFVQKCCLLILTAAASIFLSHTQPNIRLLPYIWATTCDFQQCAILMPQLILGSGIHIVCLFDLIFYVPSIIFQLNRDGSSWVEPVLTKDKCVLLKDHNAVMPLRLEPSSLRSQASTLPVSHCAPHGIHIVCELGHHCTLAEERAEDHNCCHSIVLNFLLVLSADNLCKQFGLRSGPTKCLAWSGSKLFDTLSRKL